MNTFVQWAKRQNADIVAFEELNNFTQVSLSKFAMKWGHPYAVILKEIGYPVGITSKYPITNAYKLIKGMHHGCLYVEIKGISFLSFISLLLAWQKVARGGFNHKYSSEKR